MLLTRIERFLDNIIRLLALALHTERKLVVYAAI